MTDLLDGRNPGRNKKIFLIFTSLIFCLLVLTRYQLLNGFSMLNGDRYDAVISTTILEHWFLFFQGDRSWTEVGYYFPYEKTIANTDAYFLNGLAYIPFRLLGLDIFISAELSNLVIKSTGFLGAYLLCRRVFSIDVYWSLLSAILFTLSNGMTVHSSRIQLATVAFFPVMALLVWSMSSAFLAGNMARFRVFGITAGVFYGAWCLTCFYMAWFFLFYTTVFAVVFCFSGGNYHAIKERLLSNFGSVFVVFGAAVASLAPFLYAFLPKSRETGVRLYEEALQWTVPLEGILQVGSENFLWGGIYNLLLSYVSPTYTPFGEYYNTGFPIGLFVLFLFGCIKFLRSRKQIGFGADITVIWPLVIATIITWLLVLNIDGKSPWFIIFYSFPGAKALRVVSAYQIFLALPVIIIAIKYFSLLRLKSIFIFAACILLVTEQLNKPGLYLNRFAELGRISLPLPPPEQCRSFYVSGWDMQQNLGVVGDIYAHNVTAMLIAQYAGIPTINGIASFNPQGVDFSRPNSPDYDQRVYLYAKRHQIFNLCRLDLNAKHWSIIKSSDIDHAYVRVPFFDESTWRGRIYDVQGLSGFEEWGAWSVSNTVVFEFNTPLPERFDLHLNARAFGPNIGKDFKVDAGGGVAVFRFTDSSDQKKILTIHNQAGSKILKINIPNPISPKLLSNGQSSDDRNLGIGFVEMKIVASE